MENDISNSIIEEINSFFDNNEGKIQITEKTFGKYEIKIQSNKTNFILLEEPLTKEQMLEKKEAERNIDLFDPIWGQELRVEKNNVKLQHFIKYLTEQIEGFDSNSKIEYTDSSIFICISKNKQIQINFTSWESKYWLKITK